MRSMIGFVIGWFVLSGAFMLVMHAKVMLEQGRLTLFWKACVLPWAIVGVLLDVAFNVVLGWLIFGESPIHAARDLLVALFYALIGRWLGIMAPPKVELMFSSRVKRHSRTAAGWRLRVAEWWARQLNAVDPGHIR